MKILNNLLAVSYIKYVTSHFFRKVNPEYSIDNSINAYGLVPLYYCYIILTYVGYIERSNNYFPNS